MKAEHKISAPVSLPIFPFFLMDFGLAILYFLNFLIGKPFNLITKLFDLDADNNFPNWYSSMKLFLIAYLSGLCGLQQYELGKPRFWFVIFAALAFLFLSLDEAIQIHEWLGYRLDQMILGKNRQETVFERTGIWMIILGPILALFLFLLVGQLRPILRKISGVEKRYISGIVIFLGSACGIEALANLTNTPLQFHLQIFFEELGEMLGATYIIWAMYEVVERSTSKDFQLPVHT